MANVKISALPAATSVAAADTLPIVQSATTKKATFQNVIDAVVSNEPGTSFRNRVINGDFSVNQRAFSSLTATGYGFDRWKLLTVNSTGSSTHTPQAFTAGNPITGQEPINYARLVTTGQTGAGDYTFIQQSIEDVRTLAGQQITISFWAKATSGTPKVAVELNQSFGAGGTPSADVQTYAGQVTLSTSWARYSVTVTVPSISGKTIGTTANTSTLQLNMFVSAGTSLNTRTGSLGIQSNTFDVWGVQVEAGSTASAFERRPQQIELALCQRYYCSVLFDLEVNALTTMSYLGWLPLPQPLRTTPTVTANLGGSNYTSGSLVWQTTYPNALRITATPTANGYLRINSSGSIINSEF